MVEDPITKRHQPRNYLETLEKRVAFLENLLERAHVDTSTASNVVPVTDNADDSETGPSTPRQKADDVDSLASKVGILSLSAFGLESHYLGSSSAFAFSRLISSYLRQTVPAGPATAAFNLSEGHAPSLWPCPLPDYDTATKLSNAYFENIHPQYPFLHEPTFRSWEAKLLWPLGTLDSFNSEPVPLFFLYIVCGLIRRLVRKTILTIIGIFGWSVASP